MIDLMVYLGQATVTTGRANIRPLKSPMMMLVRRDIKKPATGLQQASKARSEIFNPRESNGDALW